MFFQNRFVMFMLVLVLISSTFTLSGCGKTAQKESVCKVSTIEGTVSVARGAGKTETVSKGTKLYTGDKIITAADGTVKLKFRNFATMVLGSDSIYAIKDQKLKEDKSVIATSTELLKGVGLINVDSSKKTKFTIKTPHVITGVLGTQFGLEVGDDDDNEDDNDDDNDGNNDTSNNSSDDSNSGHTTLAVLSGLVSFEGGGKKLEVGPGCGAMRKGKTPPGLIDKFFDKNTKLSKQLQNFIKQEATGGTNLSTIFRTY